VMEVQGWAGFEGVNRHAAQPRSECLFHFGGIIVIQTLLSVQATRDMQRRFGPELGIGSLEPWEWRGQGTFEG
jgi:hypothetical protein